MMTKTHTTPAMTHDDITNIRTALQQVKYPPKDYKHGQVLISQLRNHRANIVNYVMLNDLKEYVVKDLEILCIIIASKITRLTDWCAAQKPM